MIEMWSDELEKMTIMQLKKSREWNSLPQSILQKTGGHTLNYFAWIPYSLDL